jgi:hypothetical protein
MKSIILKIADLPIKIDCDDNDFLNLIYKKHRGFIVKSKKIKPILKLRLLTEPDIKHNLQVRIIDDDLSKFMYKTSYDTIMKLEINKHTKSGFYQVKWMNPFHFDFIISIIYGYLLSHNNGLELHATSIIKNKKGYLFFGKSGDGKTTVSKSVKRGVVLNDDFSLVRKIKNKFYIFSHPKKSHSMENFWKRDKFLELNTIFRLKKSKSNKIIKLPNSKAIDYLYKSAIYKNKKTTLKILKELTKKVDVYDLYFRKKCDFWKLLDEIN